MRTQDKPIAWLHGKIKTPPFSKEARLEAGLLLRRLQKGETLSMPHSRPMQIIGKACHELRIKDKDKTILEVIKRRLDVYHKLTQPIIDYYRKKGNFFKISGEGKLEETITRIKEILKW